MSNIKEQLINEICMIDRNLPFDDYKMKLWLILGNYQISIAEHELQIYEESNNILLIKKFLISKSVSGCTERTIRCYKDTLCRFERNINKDLTLVQPDDIRLYIAEKAMNDGIKRESQRNIHRILSSFYNWLANEDIILRSPLAKVECPKKEKKKKKAFTEKEVEILRNNLLTPRDKALFEVLLSTWCRVTEISNIKLADIASDGSVEVIGKGNKLRKVYLNTRAKLAIEEYMKVRQGDSEYLFVSYDSPFEKLSQSGIEIFARKLGQRSQVAKCHPHRFRRTGATFALRAGMPIQNVSQLLGHESIETTQIYLDIDERATARSHEQYVR